MEYVPDDALLGPFVDHLATIKPDQEQRLRRIYDLFHSESGIERPDLEQLVQSLGVDVDNALTQQLLDQSTGDAGSVSFEQFVEMMQNQTFFQIQDGRHFVGLSLVEAASLRACLHIRAKTDSPLLAASPATSVILRAVTPTSMGTTLGSSLGYQDAGKYQLDIATVCYRFIDSDVNFTPHQQNLLLRALQSNPCTERIEWYKDVRGCKRRVQKHWEHTSLCRLFTTLDQYAHLEYNALRLRIRSLIKKRGMFVLDAFRAFNASGTGQITCSELFSGCMWLGLELSLDAIHAVVRSIDSDNDGLIHVEDFKAAFHEEGDEDEVLLIAGDLEEGVDPLTVDIPQRKIAELSAGLNAEDNLVNAIDLPDELVKQYKLKLNSSKEVVEKVWDNAGGAGARSALSTWHAPSGAVGERFFISVGDYASDSYNKPSVTQYLRLRHTDAGLRMNADDKVLMADLVSKFAPYPKRYHMVWSHRGDGGGDGGEAVENLYFWKPIPRNDRYVALGMVTTTNDEPPPLEAVCTVPRKWVVPTTMAPKQIWNDAGSGGRPGSVWVINEYGLIAATKGHGAPPAGPFYSLKAESFMLRPEDILDLAPTGVGARLEEKYEGIDATNPGITATTHFTPVWNDRGTGASVQCSVWRPEVPDGCVFFGDLFHGGSQEHPRNVVDGLIHAAHSLYSPDDPKVFAAPSSWRKCWKNKKGKVDLYVWRAIAPSDDFVPLGDVITNNQCVRYFSFCASSSCILTFSSLGVFAISHLLMMPLLRFEQRPAAPASVPLRAQGPACRAPTRPSDLERSRQLGRRPHRKRRVVGAAQLPGSDTAALLHLGA